MASWRGYLDLPSGPFAIKHIDELLAFPSDDKVVIGDAALADPMLKPNEITAAFATASTNHRKVITDILCDPKARLGYATADIIGLPVHYREYPVNAKTGSVVGLDTQRKIFGTIGVNPVNLQIVNGELLVPFHRDLWNKKGANKGIKEILTPLGNVNAISTIAPNSVGGNAHCATLPVYEKQ